MTNNQILFSQITDNLHAYDRLQYAIKLEVDKPGPHFLAGLYQASGELLTERKFLLEAYAGADMVIFRCAKCDPRPFWVTGEQLQDADGWIECEYCGKACERLLSDGTWQNETERQQENLRQYENH